MIAQVTVNTAGIDAIISRIEDAPLKLRSATAMEPLFREIYQTVYEDNRRGVMMGLDKDNRPAQPLKYRNSAAIQSGARSRTSGEFGRATRIGSSSRQAIIRGAAPARTNVAGQTVILPNNNLTTAQYKRLTGPRQAPRRDQSRIIANLTRRDPVLMPWGWRLEAYWADVLDAKGRPFLPHSFTKYDLRGVRPWGLERIRHLVRAYLLRMVETA